MPRAQCWSLLVLMVVLCVLQATQQQEQQGHGIHDVSAEALLEVAARFEAVGV
jgi:hypothetical protein